MHRSDDTERRSPSGLRPDAQDSLTSIGWDESRQEEFDELAGVDVSPGRVARVDGESVALITAAGATRAESSTDLLSRVETAEELPAVGDWVGVRPRPTHGIGVVEFVLSRRTQLGRARIDRSRFARTAAVEQQVLAANIDVVFVVHAANNVNLRRLEREAAQVASSGAELVVVLAKSDLRDDTESLVADVQVSMPLAPVFAASGITGDGVSALSGYAKPDRTVVFIGASGVGKSTLINRLLGRDAMATAEVREDDQRGRHTTTARHLLPLDGGGALIDTPGIRSVGLQGHDEGVAVVFEDIQDIARGCRFNDCSHANEPGCAVRDALTGGTLDEARFESFTKLNREMEFVRAKTDVRLRQVRRDVWKARTKRNRQRTSARDRFGRTE